jgi:hypothetical protein
MLLAACQNTSLSQPDLSQTIKVEQHSEPLLHYRTSGNESLFYTYPFEFSDLDKSDVMNEVNVRLAYEEGCVYLYYGPYKTIPFLPNGQASWDDKNKTLKYFNVVYEVGDIIESGGYKLRPSDRERYAEEGFANQASSRCDVKDMMRLSDLPRGQAARKSLS